jgi:hypothetical protein
MNITHRNLLEPLFNLVDHLRVVAVFPPQAFLPPAQSVIFVRQVPRHFKEGDITSGCSALPVFYAGNCEVE